MKKIFSIILITLSCHSDLFSQTDFIHDNTLYKTIYPVDLKKFMSENPKAIFIDVRSPGEFADTSRFGNLNQGRINGAINIPIDSIDKNMELLRSYMDLPIVLYCSHSQRSRRVGKKLSENGFKSIYNLNAGLTWMNQADKKSFPAKEEILTNNLPYKLVSVIEAYSLYKKSKELVVIDIRPSEQFNSSDTIEANNIGRLNNSINVVEKDGKIDLLLVQEYKDKDILVYDTYGQKSGMVSKYLTESGFKNVFNLAGGLNAIYTYSDSNSKLRKSFIKSGPSYKLVGPKEAIEILTSSKIITILDVRPAEEFNNKAKANWKNVGRIKNSINITPDISSLTNVAVPQDKKSKIFVYGSDPIAYKFSKFLSDQGYTNVYCLNNGIWSLVYSHTNIPDFESVDLIMENHIGLF